MSINSQMKYLSDELIKCSTKLDKCMDDNKILQDQLEIYFLSSEDKSKLLSRARRQVLTLQKMVIKLLS